MVIYKTTDKIPLKMGKMTVWVSPISADQKANILGFRRMQAGKEVVDHPRMALATIKHTVKQIDGLNGTKFADGSEVKLQFDDEGSLDGDSLNCVMQILDHSKITAIAAQLLISGVSGIDVPGVKVDVTRTVTLKKKG